MSDKATLKTFFETGDIPTELQFSDFIDSVLNQIETTAQSVASNVLINGQARGGAVTTSFSATKTFNMNDGNFQKMIVTASITSLAIENEINGGSYFIVLEIGGTGGYTIPTLGATFGTATDNSVASTDFPTTVGSKILITINTEPDGNKHYSIETITV